jgi:hypothetical protein
VDQKKKNLISENIRFPKIKPTQAKKTTDAMLLQLIHFSLPLIVQLPFLSISSHQHPPHLTLCITSNTLTYTHLSSTITHHFNIPSPWKPPTTLQSQYPNPTN